MSPRVLTEDDPEPVAAPAAEPEGGERQVQKLARALWEIEPARGTKNWQRIVKDALASAGLSLLASPVAVPAPRELTVRFDSREQIEVLVDDGFPIPEHERDVYEAAQGCLRAALGSAREAER